MQLVGKGDMIPPQQVSGTGTHSYLGGCLVMTRWGQVWLQELLDEVAYLPPQQTCLVPQHPVRGSATPSCCLEHGEQAGALQAWCMMAMTFTPQPQRTCCRTAAPTNLYLNLAVLICLPLGLLTHGYQTKKMKT
jgi:hypothetical protein